VGGPVRDVLLDSPIGDLDFVVEGDAPALARDLAAEVGGEVVVHHAFRTATVTLGDDRVDIVTARKEVYAHPGALPTVAPGTIADDLARRDFSINAMAISLAPGESSVLDRHGGLDDLGAGVVRALHSGSFADDPTRIFRAARYEQRLGFRLEDETKTWIDNALVSRYIGLLSPDRARHELERVFHESNPVPALARLTELGVLEKLSAAWSKVDAVQRLASRPRHGPGYAGDSSPTPMMFLAALAYEMTAGQAEDLIQRLNMPNSWAKVVRDTQTLRGLEAELASPGLLDSRTVRLLQPLSEDALRAVAQITSEKLAGRRVSKFLDELRSVSPQLDGADLMALGAPSGPELGRIIDELFDARLDGRVATVEDERRFVREALVRGGGSQVG
jgi:tRNA nucleotidyltransferase (CCA-adding enzyme)